MRIPIEDQILKQDAKLKELEADIKRLKTLYEMQDSRYTPLFLEDEYDSQIVITPLYFLAESVKIMEDAGSWGIVSAINYYFDLELKNDKQRVYCREENWHDLNTRVAIAKAAEVKDNHGYGYIFEHMKHGPSVEELKRYYTTLGVKRELVEEMGRLVNELRVNNPIRSAWAV